jgi:hypothetical protein
VAGSKARTARVISTARFTERLLSRTPDLENAQDLALANLGRLCR